MYGRGIYMSENPIYCKLYGNCIILCKVLRCGGKNCDCATVVEKDWHNIYVIPTTGQILPYCLIELKSDEEKSKFYIDQQLQHQMVQHQQQSYRILLLHALLCLYKKPEDFNTPCISLVESVMDVKKICTFPMCTEMKTLLVHLGKCSLRSKCTMKDCFSTWTLIEHWKHCVVTICQICEPYRQHKEQKRMMKLEQENAKKRELEMKMWKRRLEF